MSAPLDDDGRQGEEEVSLEPPYTEDDDIENGLQCYLCDEFTFTSCEDIVEHLRTVHGIPTKEFRNTYMYEKAKLVMTTTPFKAGDDVSSGVKCHVCKSFTSDGPNMYAKMLEHYRRQHDVKHIELKGQFIHTEAKKVIAAKARDNYAKRITPECSDELPDQLPSENRGSTALPSRLGSRVDSGGDARALVAATDDGEITPEYLANRSGEVEQDSIRRKGDGTSWKALWVRVEADGEIHTPIEIEHIAASTNTPQVSSSAGVPADAIAPTFDARADASEATEPTDERFKKMLRDVFTDVVNPHKLNVAIPTVNLKAAVYEWKRPPGDPKRNNTPTLLKNPVQHRLLDLEAFKQYMVKQRLGELTIGYHETSIKRFFSLLDIEDGEFEAVGIVCSLYQNEVFPKIMAVDLMNSKYTWSRNIVTALDHFCYHLLEQCNRMRWSEEKRMIQLFVDETIDPFKGMGGDYRKVAEKRHM